MGIKDKFRITEKVFFCIQFFSFSLTGFEDLMKKFVITLFFLIRFAFSFFSFVTSLFLFWLILQKFQIYSYFLDFFVVRLGESCVMVSFCGFYDFFISNFLVLAQISLLIFSVSFHFSQFNQNPLLSSFFSRNYWFFLSKMIIFSHFNRNFLKF